MKNFNLNTNNNDIWLTPKWIIDELGEFDLDPCFLPANERPWNTAKRMLSIKENGDGLSCEWNDNERVWLNPPYGKHTFKWVDKLSSHAGGGIALIFARTETIGFHNTIWNKADSIYFFKGRIKFCNQNGVSNNTANAPSCMISFTKEDSLSLLKFSQKNGGKFIKIK